MVKMLKSQDKNYIRTQREISKKKLNRLQESLHFIDDGAVNEDELMGFSSEDEGEETKDAKPKKSNHIVFVDTEDEGEHKNI